jgi:DNA-binding NarL/FixJ family response regulator
MKARVLIADDHELVSQGIERVLESDFDVVGIVTNGRELLEEALRLRPQVVILDIGMPYLNGIEAATRLHDSLPAVKVLFVTQHTDRYYVHAAFRAGGRGYVVKQSAAREVHEAMNAVLDGHLYISPALAKDLPPLTTLYQTPAKPGSGDMTPREREVLQLVAEGRTGKEIAQHLGISVKTVEFHKSGIMATLGLRTTAELTRYAVEHGIISVRTTGGTEPAADPPGGGGEIRLQRNRTRS